VRDAKCDYPSACNAMETLLLHKDLVNSKLFDSLIEMLEKENVKLYSGPMLNKSVKFAPPLAQQLSHEYSDLQLTIEIVDDVQAAVTHINKYGSGHTESIITKNSK
jgi:delta-1-pyrroline-5-carboxylate synthetase